ncbi:hypothetical protein [Kocuria sp. U4B]
MAVEPLRRRPSREAGPDRDRWAGSRRREEATHDQHEDDDE